MCFETQYFFPQRHELGTDVTGHELGTAGFLKMRIFLGINSGGETRTDGRSIIQPRDRRGQDLFPDIKNAACEFIV